MLGQVELVRDEGVVEVSDFLLVEYNDAVAV